MGSFGRTNEDPRPPAVRREAPRRGGRQGCGRCLPDQIIVWVSINEVLRPFPAILDTGHGHNISIGRQQLERWSGATLRAIGETSVDRRKVVQYAADVRIHRNVPGKAELDGSNYSLEMPQGISVLDEDAPRLPLIGLRTIVANKLQLLIDGERRQVTLKTKGWY